MRLCARRPECGSIRDPAGAIDRSEPPACLCCTDPPAVEGCPRNAEFRQGVAHWQRQLNGLVGEASPVVGAIDVDDGAGIRITSDARSPPNLHHEHGR
jgi:hypothetical protein